MINCSNFTPTDMGCHIACGHTGDINLGGCGVCNCDVMGVASQMPYTDMILYCALIIGLMILGYMLLRKPR